MKARYTVLGLSVFLALALAVPALGGPSNPIAHSASALSKAKKAIRLANSAQSTANTALSTANTANSTANSAKSAAAAAQSAAAAAQTSANNANANANNRVADSVSRFGAGSGTGTGALSDSVTCNTGEVTLGGGFFASATPAGDVNKVTVTTSDPLIFYNDGWFAAGQPISGFNPNWAIGAVVECGTK
jgi:trimeric autotransporter adhesin